MPFECINCMIEIEAIGVEQLVQELVRQERDNTNTDKKKYKDKYKNNVNKNIYMVRKTLAHTSCLSPFGESLYEID